MTRSRILLWTAVLLALPSASALAQDLLYDDGGSHVLDSLAPLLPSPANSLIEVRDGPGPAPTSLDVALTDIVDQSTPLSFDVHGQSNLQLLSAGEATIQTYDQSSALIGAGCCGPFVPSFTTWDQSSLIVRDGFGSGIARGSSQLVFEGSLSNELSFQGWEDSSSIQLGGVLSNTALIDSARMSVLGGFWGVEGGTVAGDAHLIVDGGSVYDSLSVSGNGVVDIHSGGLSPSLAADFAVSDFGVIQLFGSGFTLDGAPIEPGDIFADPGNLVRGVLTGTLRSGEEMTARLLMTGSSIVRIVPEPGTGLLTGLALAAALAANRRRDAQGRVRDGMLPKRDHATRVTRSRARETRRVGRVEIESTEVE